MNYGYQKDFSVGFDAFDLLVRNALSKNGFGVITEIDIHEKLREKYNGEPDWEELATNIAFMHELASQPKRKKGRK